jgi:very-short-patch-repair endonuclease
MDGKTRKKIISEYKKGKSSLDIVKIVKLSKPTILKVLNEEGLVRKRDRCSKLKIDKVGKNYVVNRTCPKCGKFIKTKSKDKIIACRNHFNKLNNSSLCKPCSLKLQVGEGNPFYGKKHTKDSLIKMTKTLTNSPRKFSSSSKPEKVIYNILKELNYSVKKSYRIDRYICDIFIEKLNLIIEYNGDYWHCNPKKYDRNYIHPHKKKTAYKIWEEDNIRIDNLRNMGYTLIVIWESEFDSINTIKSILKEYDTKD